MTYLSFVVAAVTVATTIDLSVLAPAAVYLVVTAATLAVLVATRHLTQLSGDVS